MKRLAMLGSSIHLSELHTLFNNTYQLKVERDDLTGGVGGGGVGAGGVGGLGVGVGGLGGGVGESLGGGVGGGLGVVGGGLVTVAEFEPWTVGVNATPTTALANVTGAADVEELLFLMLGPRRQSLYKVIPITIVYSLIFITGIIGNVATCVVIARNRYMQTATNYYLFNLAIADLLVLVLGLPQETYSFWSKYPWIFGETLCVLRILAAETSTYASILTITAFTVERYVAIVHPMRAQAVSSLPRATKVIIITWFVSAICAIPMVIQFGVVFQSDSFGRQISDSAQCTIKPQAYLKHAFECSTFLFFLAPMTIITVLYALIGLAIRRSTLHRAGSDCSNHSEKTGLELRAQQQARARRAVLKMLVAVVVAFFLCWAPFHSQRLMVIYIAPEQYTPTLTSVQNILYIISGVLYYVSSVINPILYNIMSLKFRQAFRSTIFRPCSSNHHKRRRKRSSLKTYRFCAGNRGLHPDTKLTFMQVHLLNGLGKKLPSVPARGGGQKCVYKYSPADRGNSDNSSTAAAAAGGANRQQLELEQEEEIVLQDLKPFYSYNPRSSSGSNTNSRPYHSFA